MNTKFDYYKNLERPDFILCNPDRRQIAVIERMEASLTLRFNDISELSFKTPSHTSGVDGRRIKCAFYKAVEAKRMVLVDGIGYFIIVSVTETENGLNSYKEVKCFSAQQSFQNIGFFAEDRVYKFYNPDDPMDSRYNAGDLESIPSVIGQLAKQLHVEIALGDEPIEPYDVWTVVSIPDGLKYNTLYESDNYTGDNSNVVRSFTEQKVLYGYEFMLNEVAEKFQVIFDFDFLNYAIRVKSLEEATTPTNIYLSFNNVMNELQTIEEADDIVTVLNCNGNNLDIRAANPTGTNYITNFSHFMYDESKHNDEDGVGWMSKELTNVIKEWELAVEQALPIWTPLVQDLYELEKQKLKIVNNNLYIEKRLEDLRQGQSAFTDKKILGGFSASSGLVTVEDISVGEKSVDENSSFYNNIFDINVTAYTCYKEAPVYEDGAFVFGSEASPEGNSFEDNFAGGDEANGFMYFNDGNSESYCKLQGKAVVEIDANGKESVTYTVSGFIKRTVFEHIKDWVDTYTEWSQSVKNELDSKKDEIETKYNELKDISDELNLQERFDLTTAEGRKLFLELKNYWIEGEYDNQGFAVLETTTPAEEVKLAQELLEVGRKELEKVSKPRFSIKVEAIDFTKLYEFREFSRELELGCTIVIEKDDNTHYNPALTSMTINLDEPDGFELVFSNVLRGSDWGFQYGDLLAKADSVSRQVTGNWKELMSFSKQSNAINELLYQPLNRTLRLAEGSMSRQEFIIDETGVLGRRYADESKSSFELEQMRMMNNVLLFTDNGWQTAKTALGKIAYTNENGQPSVAYGLASEVLVGSIMIGNKLYIKNDDGTITLDDKGIVIKKLDSESGVHRVVFEADPFGNVFFSGKIDNGLFSVSEEGYLTAKSGNIGGWNVLPDRLVSDDGSTGLGVGSSYSFWAGGIAKQYKAKINRMTSSKLLVSITDMNDVATPLLQPLSCSISRPMKPAWLGWHKANITIPEGFSYYEYDTILNDIGENDELKIYKNEKDHKNATNVYEFSQSNEDDLPFSVKPDGSLNATKGKIGGLTLSDNALSSDTFELLTNSGNSFLRFKDESGNINTQISDDVIMSKNIISEGYIQSTDVSASQANIGSLAMSERKISADKTSIEFDYGSSAVYNTARLTNDGNNRLLKITLDKAATKNHTFTVAYVVIWEKQIKTAQITIDAGGKEGAVSYAAFWGLKEFYLRVEGRNVGTSHTFVENTATTTNIKIDGSLVLKDKSGVYRTLILDSNNVVAWK